MSGLHVNYSPQMTAAIVSSGAFRSQPFTVVDVGARGGVASYWSVFGDDLRIIGFELDPDECKRLSEIDPRTRYLPYALDKQNGQRTVHVTEYSPSSSFYRTDPLYFGRFAVGQNSIVVSNPTLNATTLSAALASINVDSIDFIKLDAEGAELEILQGAERLLPSVQGILSEIRFTKRINGSPEYWEVEKYLREQSFELFDLDIYRFSRKALPYPYLYSNFFEDGRPAAGPAIQGQVLSADALYLRDSVSAAPEARRLLVAACLFEIFGLNDCAAELILAHRKIFDAIVPSSTLLDLLVPEIKGQRLTYADYMHRDTVSDPLFRPTDGRRFPEAVIPQYDGEFRASWEPRPESILQRIISRFRKG